MAASDNLGGQFSQQQLFDPGMPTHGPDRPAAPSSASYGSGGNESSSSIRLRLEDEREPVEKVRGHWQRESDGEPAEMSRHGIPAYGEAPTEALTSGRIEEYWRGGAPTAATFGGSTISARNQGDVVEIPIQSASEGFPVLGTTQSRVSTQRVNQMLDDPGVRSTSRIPSSLHRDLPVVWQDVPDVAAKEKHGAETSPAQIIDGNHRMTSAVLEGQLFQQVRQITPDNIDRVQAQTDKVRSASASASGNPNRNPYAMWDGVERNYGGTFANDLYGSRKPDWNV